MNINIPTVDTEQIECVIFDLGGVILDIDIEQTIRAFYKLEIDNLKAETVFKDNQALFLELELGLVTPEEFIKRFNETYPGSQSVSEEAVWDAWNAILLTYEPERMELLKELNQHYKVYLLSNTNLPHRICFKEKYNKQFGGNFEDLFLQCFYSDEMHLRKPDKEIYRQVEKAIKQDGSKILFIDDSPINIEAADAHGWTAYLLTKEESILDLFK